MTTAATDDNDSGGLRSRKGRLCGKLLCLVVTQFLARARRKKERN
ncbi:uncharacterized protein G2W53_032329 [Senna tora]|uniref:Uncharacterized protein n=1 Tax=Senna tora TaxID=362788 RepID=A0A834W7M1_9FABA|nr:uncharacterized protein G2W53_032329 [Senna tora]